LYDTILNAQHHAVHCRAPLAKRDEFKIIATISLC